MALACVAVLGDASSEASCAFNARLSAVANAVVITFAVTNSSKSGYHKSPKPIAWLQDYSEHHATLHTSAFLLLFVFRVPAVTISPRRASSIRLGRCVLGFIASSVCICSSVSPAGVAWSSAST